MHPLDDSVHYGRSEEDGQPGFDLYEVGGRPLPEKVQQLRSKLHQKAKAEPKFRSVSYTHLTLPTTVIV